MTIEEFMRDIAPKMRPGWVAMDEYKEDWYFFTHEPIMGENVWEIRYGDISYLGYAFDIAPVDNWTQSLRKVGK